MKGTEKQVKWAEDIRETLIRSIKTQVMEAQEKAEQIARKYADNPRRQKTITNYQLRAETAKDAGEKALYGLSLVEDAKFFIDNRTKTSIDSIRHELSIWGIFDYDAEITAPAEEAEETEEIEDGPVMDTQAKEYSDIWSVIECLYHVLGDFSKDFDVYAIAQELIFFENGRLYANLQREDFWDIVSRHDLSGVLENSDERKA